MAKAIGKNPEHDRFIRQNRASESDEGSSISQGISITRRDFCRRCAISLLALPIIDGCAGRGIPTRADEQADYYLVNRSESLAMFDTFRPGMQSLLKAGYGEEFSELVALKTREAFIRLFSEIPYIGGEDNGLTEDMVQAAMALAFYRVMKQHKRTLDETGRLLYEAYGQLLSGYPGFLFRWGWSWTGRRKNKKAAAVSQLRRFHGDWVSEYVEGDGKSFDWGMDYSECGNVKFLQSQGAFELAPYLCLLDLPTFSKAGAGLTRTTTIASGNVKCDFRFKGGGSTQLLDPWSRQTLKRWGKTV